MCDQWCNCCNPCFQKCNPCFQKCNSCTTLRVFSSNICNPCNPCVKSCDPVILEAALTGQKEVPPVNTSASGSMVAVLSTDKCKLRFLLDTCGLTSITAAHFHAAPASQNGPIVKTIPIDVSTGRAVGCWTSCDSEPLTQELVCKLLQGCIYVNVHTAAHPGGEIRGQLNVVAI